MKVTANQLRKLVKEALQQNTPVSVWVIRDLTGGEPRGYAVGPDEETAVANWTENTGSADGPGGVRADKVSTKAFIRRIKEMEALMDNLKKSRSELMEVYSEYISQSRGNPPRR